MHGEIWERSKEAKYLGVILDQKMQWNKHIDYDYVTKKGNKTLAFLRRQLKHCDNRVKKTCYEVYIRPILEHSSNVWDPHGKGNVDKIEKIQKRAARFISNIYNNDIPSDSIVSNLQLLPLQKRRANIKLITVFKAVNNAIAIPTEPFKEIRTKTRSSRTSFCIP